MGDPPTTDGMYVDSFQLVSNNDWSKGITFGVGKLWVLEYDYVNNAVGTGDSIYTPECIKKASSLILYHIY